MTAMAIIDMTATDTIIIQIRYGDFWSRDRLESTGSAMTPTAATSKLTIVRLCLLVEYNIYTLLYLLNIIFIMFKEATMGLTPPPKRPLVMLGKA